MCSASIVLLYAEEKNNNEPRIKQELLLCIFQVESFLAYSNGQMAHPRTHKSVFDDNLF